MLNLWPIFTHNTCCEGNNMCFKLITMLNQSGLLAGAYHTKSQKFQGTKVKLYFDFFIIQMRKK